jgi:hypothetical protein
MAAMVSFSDFDVSARAHRLVQKYGIAPTAARPADFFRKSRREDSLRFIDNSSLGTKPGL